MQPILRGFVYISLWFLLRKDIFILVLLLYKKTVAETNTNHFKQKIILFAKFWKSVFPIYRQTRLSLPWRQSPANALQASGVYESETFFCKDCVLFFSPDTVNGLREVGARKDRKSLWLQRDKILKDSRDFLLTWPVVINRRQSSVFRMWT